MLWQDFNNEINELMNQYIIENLKENGRKEKSSRSHRENFMD